MDRQKEILPLLLSTGWFQKGLERDFKIKLKICYGLMED